jgi:hypothetical protein
MINGARTLLLNKSGASRPSPTFFGEEIVRGSSRRLSCRHH